MNWIILIMMIIFLVISIIILLKKYKGWMHPVVLFNILWLLACIILIINPNKYYEVSFKTIFVTLLGAICFNIPAYFETYIPEKNINNQVSVDIDFIKKSKVKILFCIQLILMLSMIPLAIRAISFISIYGFAFMRNIYGDGITYGYMTTLERIIYIHYIVFPLIKVLSLVQLIMYSRGRCKAVELIPTIINQALIVIITTGRNDLLMFIVWGIFVIEINKKFSRRINTLIKKNSRIIKFAIYIAGISILIITFIRHRIGEGSLITSFMGVFQTYIGGGVQLLDLSLRNITEWRLDTLTWGMATFKGLFDSINTGIIMLSSGTIHLPNFYIDSNIQTIAAQFHLVSETKKMNAYVTIYYYFLRDFGYIGVIIITSIFSKFSTNIYKKMIKNPTLDHQINYYIILNIIFFSTIWWEPINSSFWISLLWAKLLVIILTKKVGNYKIKI